MKNFLSLLLGALLTGCATQVPPPAKTPAAPAGTPVAQFAAPGAKITHVDARFRFVVLDYRSRPIPFLGTRLGVYRAGQRVGEVQITDPVRMGFATADIRNGELHVGDEAR